MFSTSVVIFYLLLGLSLSNASVTLYIPQDQAILWGFSPTSTTASPTYTGSAAYDPTTLTPPPPPSPAINSLFNLQLYSGSVPGLSIKQHGAFLGFSIELSVSNQIRTSLSLFFLILFIIILLFFSSQLVSTGTFLQQLTSPFNSSLSSSSHLQVPFLNLLANCKERGGRVHVRVGGNSQETAVLVDSLPDGKPLEKDKSRSYNPVCSLFRSSSRSPFF
jgi:hypothetical protein